MDSPWGWILRMDSFLSSWIPRAQERDNLEKDLGSVERQCFPGFEQCCLRGPVAGMGCSTSAPSRMEAAHTPSLRAQWPWLVHLRN